MMKTACTVASLNPLNLWPAPKIKEFVRREAIHHGQSISFVFGRVPARMLHQPHQFFLGQIPMPIHVQTFSDCLPRFFQTCRVAAHGPNRGVERGRVGLSQHRYLD
jgi:hypothetical protein